MRAVFGYPGSKSAATIEDIIYILNLHWKRFPLYVEPFAGNFSFGLKYLMGHLLATKAWINTIDTDLYCLWYSILHYPHELGTLVQQVELSPDLFKVAQRRILERDKFYLIDILDRGLDKLIVQKLSHDCAGEMSQQRANDTKLWKPDFIREHIEHASQFLRGSHLTLLPFEKVLTQIIDNALVYLNPPSLISGEKQHKHILTYEQHVDLADFLKQARFKWFMTCDTHYMLLFLYQWADIYDLDNDRWITAEQTFCVENGIDIGKNLLITGGLKPCKV